MQNPCRSPAFKLGVKFGWSQISLSIPAAGWLCGAEEARDWQMKVQILLFSLTPGDLLQSCLICGDNSAFHQRHQHHLCPYSKHRARWDRIHRYTALCRTERHSPPCSRKWYKDGEGLRRWTLHSLLWGPLMPIWFGPSEPEEARQPCFDCSLKVHSTSGAVALGWGWGQVRACCKRLEFWVLTASRRNLLHGNYFNLQLAKRKLLAFFC